MAAEDLADYRRAQAERDARAAAAREQSGQARANGNAAGGTASNNR